MKELEWVASTKKDLLKLPTEVRQEIGYALYLAQKGETYTSTKLFKGYGPRVYEIVIDYEKNAYRAVYFVHLIGKIYVLHVFQKKSKSGIKTPKEVLNVIKERLKRIGGIIE